jgi:hypothetical protein
MTGAFIVAGWLICAAGVVAWIAVTPPASSLPKRSPGDTKRLIDALDRSQSMTEAELADEFRRICLPH